MSVYDGSCLNGAAGAESWEPQEEGAPAETALWPEGRSVVDLGQPAGVM